MKSIFSFWFCIDRVGHLHVNLSDGSDLTGYSFHLFISTTKTLPDESTNHCVQLLVYKLLKSFPLFIKYPDHRDTPIIQVPFIYLKLLLSIRLAGIYLDYYVTSSMFIIIHNVNTTHPIIEIPSGVTMPPAFPEVWG